MSDITITVKVKDIEKAKDKAKEFFNERKIKYTDDAFNNDDWAGRYRFVRNLESYKNKDVSPWTLEITFTDRPWLMVEEIIDPVIQEFFEGV